MNAPTQAPLRATHAIPRRLCVHRERPPTPFPLRLRASSRLHLRARARPFGPTAVSSGHTKEHRMKAVVMHEHGGPEVLRYEDLPDPLAAPGEALVRVRACALNHLD